MEITVLAVALLLLAAVLVGVGLASLTARLPRNRWLGVRVAATVADEEGWRAGHRAAGGTLIASAGPPLLLAIALLVRPPAALAEWFLVYAVVGVLTGGLIAVAVRQADRVATDSQSQDGPPPEA